MSISTKVVEDKITSFYRGLDTQDYSIFYRLPEFAESLRSQVRPFGNEVKNTVYGLLAEETAHYLLRMYKDAGYPLEIIDSLVFEYEKGKTTEVDLIVVTPNMVYVIECKHRSRDITILSDGTLQIDGKNQSPIDQNIGHIKRLFNKAGYGNLVTKDRILNIVYLMLNNCRVQNPITLFNKELNGAFAGRTNLLPLIHKFETEKAGGRIPYVKFADSLRKLDLGEEGMKYHIGYLKDKYNES